MVWLLLAIAKLVMEWVLLATANPVTVWVLVGRYLSGRKMSLGRPTLTPSQP